MSVDMKSGIRSSAQSKSEIHPNTDSQTAARAGGPGLLYIDDRRLSRHHISRELALYLPELAIETATSARELSPAGSGKRFALTVLHAHTAPIDELAVSSQLSLLGDVMPDVPLVLLSDADEADNIVKAFRLGIRGYIPTSLSMKDTAAAIRFIRVGGTFVPRTALSSGAPDAIGDVGRSSSAKAAVRFTPRQWEVIRGLWQGKANKAIAYELGLSQGTVKIHIRHIMRKLHARSRTQIVLLTHPVSESAVPNRHRALGPKRKLLSAPEANSRGE
jgi:DNA-binding NarL/FixJ family response regulator